METKKHWVYNDELKKFVSKNSYHQRCGDEEEKYSMTAERSFKTTFLKKS
jgi:hypothetical protein